MTRSTTRTLAVALLSGALFGLGLAVSGMTNPDKVLNFLDVAGRWDASLGLVMGGALLVTMPGFAWLRRRNAHADGCNAAMSAPRGGIDRRLIVGSALFGIGWGIAGYCPGPGLANLLHAREAVFFVLAMIAGSQLMRRLQR